MVIIGHFRFGESFFLAYSNNIYLYYTIERKMTLSFLILTDFDRDRFDRDRFLTETIFDRDRF